MTRWHVAVGVLHAAEHGEDSLRACVQVTFPGGGLVPGKSMCLAYVTAAVGRAGADADGAFLETGTQTGALQRLSARVWAGEHVG